jgi:hypothetical protein
MTPPRGGASTQPRAGGAARAAGPVISDGGPVPDGNDAAAKVPSGQAVAGRGACLRARATAPPGSLRRRPGRQRPCRPVVPVQTARLIPIAGFAPSGSGQM